MTSVGISTTGFLVLDYFLFNARLGPLRLPFVHRVNLEVVALEYLVEKLDLLRLEILTLFCMFYYTLV